MTTRKAKLAQTALRGKSEIAKVTSAGGSACDLDVFATESAALLALDDRQEGYLLGAGGEALPQDSPEMRDTMKTPGAVALDASAERLRLVTQVGVDTAAMAIDAAVTISASNSLEKMAAHQMALLNKVAFDYAHKAAMHPDTQTQVKLMNVSIRAVETYQRGLLTIKRLRSSGDQRIVIERVNVEAGGQAIVGNIERKGMP
jgi:hypothetical protein